MAFIKTGIGIILLLISSVVFGQQVKDTIVLYNGQILIGDVLGVESGVLSIKELDLKNLKIRLSKIKTFKTSREYKVETTSREVYYGSLHSSNRNGWVDIVAGVETLQSVNIMSIASIVSLEKNFFKRLNGNLSAGVSYTKSSDIGQINLSSNILAAGKKMSYQLTTSEYVSIDSSTASRDREQYQLFSTLNLSPIWFAAGLLNYQRNLELSLASRYQTLLGAGNKTITRNDLRLYFISGLTFSTEHSTEGSSSGLLMEVPLMMWFSFFKFKDPNLQISSSQTFYVGLTQAGRIRVDGNSTLSYEIVKDFKFNFNVYNSFDNQPPSGGNTFDYGFSFGLGYTF